MNLFDLIGAIELTATAAIVVASLAGALGRTWKARSGLAAAFAAWFGLIVFLAANGCFDPKIGIGVRGVGAAVIGPIAILSWAGSRLAGFRSAIARMSLPLLVGVNAVRVLGVSFILLYGAGRLSAPFAPVAGWGDVFIGFFAEPGTRIIGSLPWILIPGFLVPNLALTHLAIFRKIRSAGSSRSAYFNN
jgi:hypothetical protein